MFLTHMPDVRIELGVMNDSKTGATSYSVAYHVGERSTYYLNRPDLQQIAGAILDIIATQGIEHPCFAVQPRQDKLSSNMTLPSQDTITTLDSLLRDPATLADYAAIPDASPVSRAI